MDNFYRHGLSRQDLNIRAAHSLCRAGWMLTEVNGVLQNGSISLERFARIRQQATTFDQLQRKFGPPPQLSATDDLQTIQVNLRKTLTIRVMNRGVEEAAAVLTHHGWHYSQIQNVLKPSASPMGNLNVPCISHKNKRIVTLRPSSTVLPHYRTSRPRGKAATGKIVFALFWLGGLVFVIVSLMLHML